MVLKNGTQRYNGGGGGDRRLFKLKVFVASIYPKTFETD